LLGTCFLVTGLGRDVPESVMHLYSLLERTTMNLAAMDVSTQSRKLLDPCSSDDAIQYYEKVHRSKSLIFKIIAQLHHWKNRNSGVKAAASSGSTPRRW
jgi:hypothetical protein